MVFKKGYGMGRLRLWLVFTTASALLASGCITVSKRQVTMETSPFAMLPNGRDPLNPTEFSSLSRDVRSATEKRVKLRGGQALIGLQLSGGGQNGAFGAGFLKGWAEKGTRPEFDFVTGVSTGAILSTFAFLGTEEDDNILRETWLSLTRNDIYRKEGSLLRLATGGDSLYDTEPLSELIEKLITPQVMERVAVEYDKERRLLVSTTNLDTDQTWVWDLTAIAKHGGEDALDLYRKAVIASASPPILFSPVEINGALFADGGTRHNLLLLGLQRRTKEIVKKLERKGNYQWLPPELYIIMHHKHHDMIREPIPKKDVKNLVRRSVNIMIDTSTADSLLRNYFISELQGFKFNLVQIPADVDAGDDRLAFDPAIMKALYEAGLKLGRSPNPWKHEPPATDEIAPWVLKEAAKGFKN